MVYYIINIQKYGGQLNQLIEIEIFAAPTGSYRNVVKWKDVQQQVIHLFVNQGESKSQTYNFQRMWQPEVEIW